MNFNKSIYCLCALALLVSTGCSRDIEIFEEQIPTHNSPEVFNAGRTSGFFTDVVRVKFTPELANRIEGSLRATTSGLRSTEGEINDFLLGVKALKVTRVFPHAGKYESRQRKAGLHLWYDISIDDKNSDTPQIALQRAMNVVRSLSGVQVAEEVRVLKTPTTRYIIEEPSVKVRNISSVSRFNDPELPKQWHYHNNGTLLRSKAGADINLFEAWKIETGKPNVIVGITDGGIDYLHEDLHDNMYVNEQELDGEEGIDDDQNGFVDDVYGYNFVLDSGDISFHEHGTHVAGTVAARNNNGVGVAGVAGGDGSQGSGVKLMSCQMFHQNEEGRTLSSGGARAIVYAANNGAVISQNSWGYVDNGLPQNLSQSDKEAIDYFIKYAGCDENGNQLPDSPMKGGVVIFAAGNDNKDFLSIPASYNKVISVSAMSPNFTKASYTNRGDWVTIMAPGGDQDRYGTRAGVLSTLSPKVSSTGGGLYGYMQGTSMACPHVSGIAALIVSRFGGQGYTKDDLIKQLKASFLDVDINEKNPGFEGRLGLGYIDTYRALTAKNMNKAPNTPKVDMERSSKAGITDLTVFWTIPTDEDDLQPSKFLLYISKEPLTEGNYDTKGTPLGKGESTYISASGRKAGDEMSFTAKELIPETVYHFALVAVDRWGLKSKPVIFEIKTKPNTPPTVTGLPEGGIRLNASIGQVIKFDLTVQDPDGHTWKMLKPEYMKGVTITHKPKTDKVSVSIYPTLPEGKHQFTLVFVDELGARTELVVPFEIYKIQPPKVLMPITNKLIGVQQGPTEIDLTKVFEGDKETTLTFSAATTDANTASATVEGNKLILKAHKPGQAAITVTAKDGIDNTVESRFEVLVVADKNLPVYSVYPIPTKTVLNAWLNDEVKTATFIITTMRGEEVLRKEVKPNEEGVGTVNIKNFVPGAYTLTITSSKGTFTKTIVKQ